MRDWLVTEGLDVDRIVVEAEARSTYENALYCARLIAAQGFRRVTLVTERYHILRSRVLLAQALARRGMQIELRMSSVPDHLGVLERISRCLTELTKLAADICRPPRL